MSARVAIVIIALVLAGAVAVHVQLTKHIAEQQARIAATEGELVRLRAIADTSDLEREAEQIRARLLPVERLIASRRGAVCFIVWIDNVLHEHAAELSSLNEGGGNAELAITARDNANISEVMRALQKNPGLSSVATRFNITDDAWEYSIPGKYGARISMRVDYAATCNTTSE